MDSNYGIRHSGNRIPGYLITLVENNRKTNSDDLDWFESEFKYQLDGIAGVAIADLRDNE